MTGFALIMFHYSCELPYEVTETNTQHFDIHISSLAKFSRAALIQPKFHTRARITEIDWTAVDASS